MAERGMGDGTPSHNWSKGVPGNDCLDVDQAW